MISPISYFEDYSKYFLDKKILKEINKIITKLKKLKKSGKKLIICGNGGSAGSAGHLIVDFTKQAKLRAINFNDPSLITAFSNDYGFSRYIEKALEFYADKGDVVIFLSVSGNSKNLVNGIKYCIKKKFFTISFSGSNKKNYLNLKSNLKIHIPSYAYNKVECTHLIFLTYIVDSIIGKSVYKV